MFNILYKHLYKIEQINFQKNRISIAIFNSNNFLTKSYNIQICNCSNLQHLLFASKYL